MSNVEQRARDMGWRPLDEWNGPEEDWKSAEDFLRVADNYMPVLKERLTKLEDLITDLRADNAKQRASLEKLSAHHRGTWKRQYERALNEVKQMKVEAVETGNTDLYNQLEDKEQQILEEAGQQNPDAQEGPVPEFFTFKEENPWYMTDPEMTMYADGLQTILVNQEGITDHKTFFQEVAKRVRMRFPEKFKNQNQDLPPVVEPGGEGGDNLNIEKGWADMPKQERDEVLKAFPDLFTKDYTKEDYAKEYWMTQ